MRRMREPAIVAESGLFMNKNILSTKVIADTTKAKAEEASFAFFGMNKVITPAIKGIIIVESNRFI